MAAEPAYCGRFAPSPTGPLHLGSLLAALASWLHARAAGGRWLVRVEDLDPPREVAGAAEDQLATLEAFGLVPDGPVLRQSQRAAAYEQALDCLLAAGQAYACACSRAELAAHGGRHPAHCVATPAAIVGRPAALRLRVGTARIGFEDGLQGRYAQDLAVEVGDFVVRRSEGWAAYQLAVVVDDAAQGITHVVRGADLLDSTPRQILLQRLLGLPTPRYLHLPLLVDAAGQKLSKSEGAAALDRGDPLPALNRAWQLLGQDAGRVPARGSAPAWLQAARGAFDPARLRRAATIPVGAA